MKIEKVNIANKLESFSDFWNPRVVGKLNGQMVKVAKFKGDFVRHQHEGEDELFMVVSGELFIELDDKTLQLSPGELVVIPKGVYHKPYATNECAVLLFEPEATLNTGNQINTFTKNNLEEI